jgi:hypothetical protein
MCRLEVRRAIVRGIRADPTIARGWWKGFRLPGTHIPGVITAGTFHKRGKRIFWDVKNPEKAIVVDLADERYEQVIVEVTDPAAEVQKIQSFNLPAA